MSEQGKKILILGGRGYSEYFKPYAEFGERSLDTDDFISNPTDYRLVVFCGGTDVSPVMYGEASYRSKNISSGYDVKRDMIENFAFKVCRALNIPMSGICRGAQFLWSVTGGKLIQDVNNHCVREHSCTTKDGTQFNVTSSHHQMANSNFTPANTDIIAWSTDRRADRYIGASYSNLEQPEKEVESFRSEDIVAFQFHPEWRDTAHPEFTWSKDQVENLLSSF